MENIFSNVNWKHSYGKNDEAALTFLDVDEPLSYIAESTRRVIADWLSSLDDKSVVEAILYFIKKVYNNKGLFTKFGKLIPK